MINPATQELKDFNTKLIRKYIFETHRDMVLEPENELMREYIRSGKKMWQMQKKNDGRYLQEISKGVRQQ